MKNFKKILVVVCICALLIVGCAVVAFATEEYTGTVEGLAELVTNAEAATTNAKKLTALQEVKSYLDKTPVDPSAEGYDDVINRAHVCALACFSGFVDVANADAATAATASQALDSANVAWSLFTLDGSKLDGYSDAAAKYDTAVLKCAGLLLANVDANIETTLATASNRVAINTYNAFVKNHRLKMTAMDVGYAELNVQYATLLAAHEAAVAANLATLDEVNNIGDYNLPTYVEYDCEGSNVQYVPKDSYIGDFYFSPKATSNKLGIAQESNGNKYMHSTYLPTEVEDNNTYIQLPLSKYDVTNGFVMEFDFTTFDELPGEEGVKIEAGGFDMPFGRGFPAYYLQIDKDGNIFTGTDPYTSERKELTLANAIVPGEWLHIAIVFNANDFTYTLIIDGQALRTYTAKCKDTVFDHSKGAIRFSGKAKTGSLAIDNFVLYSGNNYRNLTKLSKMTDDEKFVYYSEYFSNTDKDVNGRNEAYATATSLLGNYWVWTDQENGVGHYTDYTNGNELLKAAVDRYLEFDFEELLANTRTQNLQTYISMISALEAIDRTPDTISDRQEIVNKVDAFVTLYIDLIDQVADNDEDSTPDYSQYNAILRAASNEIIYDTNASTFVRHMTRFQLVESTSALERYYNRANSMVNDGLIDLDMARNEDHPDRANFPEFIAAYQVYISAADHVKEVKQNENSKKIVGCIGFINGYTTEEEWLANFDLMNKYLDLVHNIVANVDEVGDLLYNDKYEGVGEALEFYDVAYSFFYDLRQDQHVAYLTEILALISETDAYIEKMGMVSLIDRYLAANDVNREDSRVISIINDTETCRAELELRREDYAKLLEQNAVYFVNAVEYMRTAQTYAEQRRYFEEASLLYFNLDITVEGTPEAVEIYDEFAVKLDRIEKSSLAFVEAVDIYKTCETAEDKYAALVECYYNAQFVELSYEGAAEAMEYYLAEYNAYMNYAEAVNEEVIASGNAVGSLRVNCGITHIIAIIVKKVFGE